MEKKKKILYLMNISWGWIKQRPHFIAEGLSDEYDVTVVAKKDYHSTEVKNSSAVSIYNLFRLPLERFPIIKKVNRLLAYIQLKYLAFNADIVWYCAPGLVDLLKPSDCLNKQIVYDCMDDYCSFPGVEEDGALKETILKQEGELYNRADIVFSSAKHLANVLSSRYGKRDITIVNNAIKDSVFDQDSTSDKNLPVEFVNCNKKKIVYIGTISEWLDVSLITRIAENDNIAVFLFGPVSNKATRVERDNVYYMGSIEHNLIFSIMESSDAMFMPFIVNQLIESVNPVKLYEYIYSGKPSFAPYYEESSFFGDYVYLYHNDQELLSWIEKLVENNLPLITPIASSRDFCRNNTWKKRIEDIKKVL